MGRARRMHASVWTEVGMQAVWTEVGERVSFRVQRIAWELQVRRRGGQGRSTGSTVHDEDEREQQRRAIE